MLNHDDLYTLEQYDRIRPEFRARVMAHKKSRRVSLGAHASLHFEDRLTMQYQVQEMLRLERIYEADLIQEELNVYNPLIPVGSNWKATFMIEFPDPEERRQRLASLIGIEQNVWVRVAGQERIFAIANEDLQRSTAHKTSAVHFLRFELTPTMVGEVYRGGDVYCGISHPDYPAEVTLADSVRNSLRDDLCVPPKAGVVLL